MDGGLRKLASCEQIKITDHEMGTINTLLNVNDIHQLVTISEFVISASAPPKFSISPHRDNHKVTPGPSRALHSFISYSTINAIIQLWYELKMDRKQVIR